MSRDSISGKTEEAEIVKLLQNQKRESQRGWRCPDEMQLAAFVDQRLSGSARQALEAHITDCDFCLTQVSFLTESAGWPAATDVPAHLLSKARNLVPQKPGRAVSWGWHWAAAAAAAAFLLFVVAVALHWGKQQTVPVETGPLVAQQHAPEVASSPPVTVAPPGLRPAETKQPGQKARSTFPSAPALRSKASEESQPGMIFPREGALLRPGDLEFRWRPVSETIFYEVRVTSAGGNLVFEDQTEDTKLKPGSNASLVPGEKYFVVIRAHLRQGKTAKSSVVSFRLSEQ
jgi:hypothetical protein